MHDKIINNDPRGHNFKKLQKLLCSVTLSSFLTICQRIQHQHIQSNQQSNKQILNFNNLI